MSAHLTERRLEVVSAVLPARETAEADRLEATAEAASERAKDANQHADNYMLAVVLFASALFFAGISSKFTGLGVRAAILSLGCLVALVTLAWVATLPVHLTS